MPGPPNRSKVKRKRGRDCARARDGNHAAAIDDHLPALRHRKGGDDADGCVPVLLPVHRLRSEAQAEAGRLLRVLLVWLGAVPADAGGTD